MGHHALIEGDYDQIKRGLIITVVLGVYFTILQGLEYYEASFSFADGVYGSTFFIATARLLIICTRRRHIIHFMNTTTNWPPKRSMMYAILFKQKEIETILKFPYLCHFFLILIDASYF